MSWVRPPHPAPFEVGHLADIPPRQKHLLFLYNSPGRTIVSKRTGKRGGFSPNSRVNRPRRCPGRMIQFRFLRSMTHPLTKEKYMWSSLFWKASAERAIKTFAQTLVALVGTDAANVLVIGIGDAVQASVVAAVLSVLTSLASSSKGNPGPSLTSESTGG
jgi:hypothetical protein